MSAMATSAPARASVNASARPSPRDPPVTSATCPVRSIWIAKPAQASRESTSVGSRQEDLAGDHEPLDLRRALVDLEQLRVAHELLDRIFLDVAVAAEDLDGVGRHPHRGVGGEALRERRVQGGVAAETLVEHPRCL